ncbi:MAG: glycosyltransferase family 2 protein [Bdellovibrionales bacterium]|nr:glycosyltransferase family 2 protein [Bdellovibrionales bacterium]
MAAHLESLSVVIPCFNEEDSIPIVIPRMIEVLDNLKSLGRIGQYELVVVNDRSTDRSAERLWSYPQVRILNSTAKVRGYGSALKEGFTQSKSQWLCFLDMDNTYRPEDLPKLLDALDESQCDFAMGVRGFSEKGMSLTRGIGNWLYMKIAQVFYGSPLKDVCSGYRVFHRRHLPDVVSLPENGLDFSIHFTLEMILNNTPIAQVPIQYDPRLGASKLSVISDGLSFLKVLMSLKLRRIRGIKHSQV